MKGKKSKPKGRLVIKQYTGDNRGSEIIAGIVKVFLEDIGYGRK